MEILNELRQATGAIHGRIEELPICREMLAGTVDRAAYARLLGDLFHLHRAYETALAACPPVAALWPQTPSRAAALARDLAAFGVAPRPTPGRVVEWQADIEALEHPAAWAGVGYVVEGSRLGSRVLVRSLATGFGLKPALGVGLDYHLDAGDDPSGNWRRVLGALAALDRDPPSRRAILTAAVATFEALYELHEAAAEVPTVSLAAD
jgi:heme oxygenase